ncbi:MAG: FAD-dependent oxidoreductase [Planctomycetales bacterium]|nr:FAD-dependent oxidoreductase [Planctomycetales bacterium]
MWRGIPNSLINRLATSYILIACIASVSSGSELLVEAESFDQRGGWMLDTQFIQEMGSPYLLAHGIGQPVNNAATTVRFPATGRYRVFVRTKDWVARWKAPGAPGKFQLLVNGQALPQTFGTQGAQWHWQDGGSIDISDINVALELKDLSGFDGRCDAIYFTTEDKAPPNVSEPLAIWRREQLGLAEEPLRHEGYDLVVIGGGYAGMGAAISAARMGCKVALIQDRPVLGGNGSSEVRVWAMGNIRRGRFPRIGEIIEEFADHATKSPGRADEFGDELKEAIVRAEKNIDLYLNHHAYRADVSSGRIQSVTAFDTRTSQHTEFHGRLFSDCTGHGTIGFLAGADWEMEEEGRMGMSNMWTWDEIGQPTSFPQTPWALDLNMEDFPYPVDHHGQWFWESGFDKDAIGDAEGVRDHNLRAVFGAFNAMKNRDGAPEHRNAILTWVAYVGGPRESRRLMGDVVLTHTDIIEKREFPDGCVPSTWSIDLHYPKKQYAEKFPDNPFISIAVHDRRIDRQYGYPVPYRCFYSRNIDNLFMAGRDISVTHEALGTTRVMKTCGMMGEVVGRAASICRIHDCDPRDVYTNHLNELIDLLHLPGKARRATTADPITIPDDSLPLAGPLGPLPGLEPAQMQGLVVDDREAEKIGKWTEGTGLKGFVGYGYVYSNDPGASITFRFQAPADGRHEIRISYLPHENRATNARATVNIESTDEQPSLINMRMAAPLEQNFFSLGDYQLVKGQECSVTLSTKGADGLIHADAIQVLAHP